MVCMSWFRKSYCKFKQHVHLPTIASLLSYSHKKIFKMSFLKLVFCIIFNTGFYVKYCDVSPESRDIGAALFPRQRTSEARLPHNAQQMVRTLHHND
jgi:hypothetical protein